MKTNIVLFLAVLTGASCSEKINQECPQLLCTEQFVQVTVQFKDTSGKPVGVTDFKSVNLRTKQVVENTKPDMLDSQLYYIIASDASKNNFSEKGDEITVTATHPETKKPVKAGYLISGGKCVCHISKLSGPEVIIFE